MWILFLLVVAIIIIYAAKRYSDKANKEKLAKEKIEREKQATAEAKIKKENYEKITDEEKRQLSLQEDSLSAVLNAFDKAVNGDTEAMVFMGVVYQSKLQNPQKSFYWIQKSANAGNSEGLYWLGEFYVSGYGVSKNRIKGVNMIMQAASKGNELAIQSLKDNGMTDEQLRSCGIIR